jgi:hypothetical protein
MWEKKKEKNIYIKKNPFFFFFFNFNFILNLLTKKNGFNLRIQTVVLEKFQYKFWFKFLHVQPFTGK